VLWANPATASTEVKRRVASHQSGPLMTVAIPTCNGAAHLAETIGSVLSQEGVDFELIVSDDRSDDDTLTVVRAAAGDRARVLVNSERLGLAGNWNRCAALARAPLVAIFHQDDIMLAGHLSAHAASFASDSTIGLTASASVVIDELGRPVSPALIEQGGLGPIDRIVEPGQLASSMAAGNPLRCSAVTLRVAAFKEERGFDPELRYVVDWDCWLRLSRIWRTAWLARPTVRVRWHPASETHRFKTGLADLDESAHMLETLFELDLKDHADLERLRRAAHGRLGRAFLNRAHDALGAGQPELAREALRRVFQHSPSLLMTILSDPGLCVEMAVLAAAPRLAARLFASRNRC
jgi:glycosyltransferase involved in cell wall biosynthesis